MAQEKRGEDTFMFNADPPTPPPPPIPPDQRKATFKEKVMGTGPVKRREPRQFRNLVTTGVMEKENVNGDRLFPSFDFAVEAKYDKICQPLQGCLVIKLLGKHIGYTALCEKLRLIWRPTGGMEVTDVHHGYFMVRFDSEMDREKAMTGAPWLIYDHYLSVKPWTKDFVAADEKINTTMVWIRIPGLGMQFYDEDILLTLATGVGTPIKVDMNTADMRLGKFARICVEIDLDKPVVGTLRLRGTWYNIEYEGLHLLCSKCGCYGHLSRKCKVVAPTSTAAATQSTPAAGTSAGQGATLETAIVTVNEDTMQTENHAPKKAVTVPMAAHGNWLNVAKPKRKQNNNATTGPPKSKGSVNVNRFQTLATISEGVTDSVIGGKKVTSANHGVGSRTGEVNAKKRSRREEGKQNPVSVQAPLRILARQETHQVTPPVSGKVGTGTQHQPRTRMVGDKVVYDLGGGAMSTMNLQSTGGCGYKILNAVAHTAGNGEGCSGANDPIDPGPQDMMVIVPTK
ncbi:uncharacterized protein LOC130719691 [Lotus japonicus]|uniref:uncharacterized protein LOC130719691 n=1 Tax=Lotus japonicus TaxID=34305 RepID=UPI00258683BF|nr:uncharacterized protein LOC130719691 [Lotus japonicus]